jgi:hypothetical protein
MVKVEIKNGEVELQGNFIFKVSDGVIKEDNGIFSKEIKFNFNPECDANINSYIDNVKLNEMIGEKLKKDFIKFLSNE